MNAKNYPDSRPTVESKQVPTTGKEVLTVYEAAEFLGLSSSTLYKYVSERKIPFSKRNGSVRFLRSTLLDWLKADEKPTLNQLIR
jgi:excisionase family DNA binding protein